MGMENIYRSQGWLIQEYMVGVGREGKEGHGNPGGTHTGRSGYKGSKREGGMENLISEVELGEKEEYIDFSLASRAFSRVRLVECIGLGKIRQGTGLTDRIDRGRNPG